MSIIKTMVPMTDVMQGKRSLEQQIKDTERAIWDQFESDQTGYRIEPRDYARLFDNWLAWKQGVGPELNEIQQQEDY